jgi:alpha-L-fucosidase
MVVLKCMYAHSTARRKRPLDGPQHHDGFELWPSSQASGYGREWNAVDVGPKRDLLGDLFTALRAEGLKAGIYHSLFEWFNPVYVNLQ